MLKSFAASVALAVAYVDPVAPLMFLIEMLLENKAYLFEIVVWMDSKDCWPVDSALMVYRQLIWVYVF